MKNFVKEALSFCLMILVIAYATLAVIMEPICKIKLVSSHDKLFVKIKKWAITVTASIAATISALFTIWFIMFVIVRAAVQAADEIGKLNRFSDATTHFALSFMNLSTNTFIVAGLLFFYLVFFLEWNYKFIKENWYNFVFKMNDVIANG